MRNCLNLHFGTEGSSRKMNEAYFLKQEIGDMEKIYTWRVPQGPAQFPVFPTGLNEHPEIHIKWGHLSNVLHLGEHLINCSNFESHIHSNWESESGVAQLCLILCDSMDCSLTGSSIHGIFQARILEWAAISFSRRSSQAMDWTWVSRIVDICFTIWATSNWEEENKYKRCWGCGAAELFDVLWLVDI